MAAKSTMLRVAVIGAGRMGLNHLRIYDLLKGITIVAVVDADPARAAEAAQRFGCQALTSVDQLVGKVDAVSVCAPSSLHAEIGGYLLDNGIHCLIEKPLATSEAECQMLIDRAHRKGVTLLVGHVERFNPAVRQLASLLEDGHRVHAIDARRLSWASSRITDVDVVLDLMVHDLDIVLWLISRPLTALSAFGVHSAGSQGQDYASALLSFDNGVMASLTASRITQTKVRQLYLTTDLGYITLDYINQEVLVYRHGAGQHDQHHWANSGNVVLDSVVERVLIRNAEPLVQELQHFVDAVRNGTRPLVTGEQALDAMRVAGRIHDEIARAASHG